MAHHRYAKSKSLKKRAKRILNHARAEMVVAFRRQNSPRPAAYTYRDCDITRNAGGHDNQRWAATKPSAKEGFSGVHIGDFATIGAARRAIDGFKAVLSGRG